jgi:hypothetical protein
MNATRILRPRNVVLAVASALGLFLAGVGYGARPPAECIAPPTEPPPVELPPE